MAKSRAQRKAEKRAREAADEAGLPFCAYGHLGDGNLHIAVPVQAEDYLRLRPTIEQQVYAPLAAFQGSVSAEHGIGLEKKPYLHISRNENELQLMRILKAALDPSGVLNPGKIF